ncbi:ubiquitin-conjugating enzyme E2 Z-like [Rhipicephalus microplus]|uniref:ubiquitin-conjugating enzyme E2 Z-like n=1 Tax=Rhipicephalus microplus TaxID=6941 RepID=UPI003F6CF440
MDEARRSAATCNFETALAKPNQPSGQCLLRLNHDLKNIIDNPVPGIFVEPEKGDITYVHAVIVVPDHTPCQGGLFHFVLKFPLNYPNCPPQVRFMTTDGGRVRFNRKLYCSGLVSLSIPGTFHGPSWNPEMTLKTVVVSIQSSLIEQPLADEPALGRELETWLEKTVGCNAKLRSQTLRVAICDALEACLLGNSLYPQDLQTAVMKHFVQDYDKYENVAFSLLGEDSSKEESQQYAALLERLQDLYDRILQNSPTMRKICQSNYKGIMNF